MFAVVATRVTRASSPCSSTCSSIARRMAATTAARSRLGTVLPQVTTGKPDGQQEQRKGQQSPEVRDREGGNGAREAHHDQAVLLQGKAEERDRDEGPVEGRELHVAGERH